MDSTIEKSFVVFCTFNSYHNGLNKPYSIVRIPLKNVSTDSLCEEVEDLIEILLSNFYDLEPTNVLDIGTEESSHNMAGYISGDSPPESIKRMADNLMSKWNQTRSFPQIIFRALDKTGEGLDPELDALLMQEPISWD